MAEIRQLVMARTAESAVALKGRRSAFLAGGTEVNRLGSSVETDRLVGIGRIQVLDGIDEFLDEETGIKYVRIGAMSTFQDIIGNPLVPGYLKEACLFMGSRTKRNMATIGGNVALRRTDSYLYATLLACHAKLSLMCRDGAIIRRCTRRYLEENEEYRDMLIMEILVPADAMVVTKRYSNTAQSHAVLTVSEGIAEGRLRIAVAAKDTYLGLLPEITEAVSKRIPSDEELLKMIASDSKLDFKADIYGSPEYKRYLLAVTIADLSRKVRGGEA